MYAVKNEDDKLFVVRSNDNAYLYQDQNGNLGRTLYRYYSRKDAQRAIERAGHVNQCHVVPLVEKPEPVEVSEDEADKLERAKVYGNPADVILALAANHHPDDAEHILRAYVNGWTVEKAKRWNVKVPHTKEAWYYQYGDTDLLTICPADKELRGKFTEAEIDHYGLQDCEKEEVTDDE